MHVCALMLLSLCAQAQVVFVAEMSRHGSRAPVYFFPWDEDGRWEIGAGELTVVGMRQHYLLGSELAVRYKEVFGGGYNSSLVFAQSTDVNRTLMSAQCQMMGLFAEGPELNQALVTTAEPPISVTNLKELEDQLANRALPNQWQPIPVHTDSASTDTVLKPNTACKALVKAGDALLTSQEYNATAFEDELVVSVLTQELPGVDLTAQFLNIFNSILCNQFVGFPLPPAFTQEFLDRGNVVFNKLFALYYADDLTARLYASGFLQELLSHLQAVSVGTEPTRFRYYSSHEETVAGVLAGLQVFPQSQPPFASTLVFEVSQGSFPDRQGETGLAIQLLYNDVPMRLPTCPSTMCPLTTFIEYVQFRSLPNFQALCEDDSVAWSNMTESSAGMMPSPGKGSSAIVWVGWLAVGLCACAGLAGIGFCLLPGRRKEAKLQDYREMSSESISTGKPGLSLQVKV